MWKFFCDICESEIKEKDECYRVRMNARTIQSAYSENTEVDKIICKKCARDVKKALCEFVEVESNYG